MSTITAHHNAADWALSKAVVRALVRESEGRGRNEQRRRFREPDNLGSQQFSAKLVFFCFSFKAYQHCVD